jgi:hypothetical protein
LLNIDVTSFRHDDALRLAYALLTPLMLADADRRRHAADVISPPAAPPLR